VLLRLGCLTVSNVFAMLRLLPMGDRDKDVEILALCHQIAVLERRLGKQRMRPLLPPIIDPEQIARGHHDGVPTAWL
jgi:hypothetical protein